MSKNATWLKWFTEIQAMAQCGLNYSTNAFDIDRYQRLRIIAADMMATFAEEPPEVIHDILLLEKGHATPKVDVRSFTLEDNKLLLVRERADNLWTLPGGWIDVNESAAEAVVRETQEESGYDVSTIKLLALWDKQKHDHPPQWPHIYKIFFQCKIIAGEPKSNLEISDIDFFDMDELPPLSTPRVTHKQLIRLYKLAVENQATAFD